MADLQLMWNTLITADFEEFLLQLNIAIWDSMNQSALDLKLNSCIAPITY